MRLGDTHILSTSPQLSTDAGVARCDAVSRVESPKATVYSSTASTGVILRPFDRLAGASRLAHAPLMRANEPLTSPMVWF